MGEIDSNTVFLYLREPAEFIAVIRSNGGEDFREIFFPEQDVAEGWMERENEMIACCSDGTRPVVFKIERIDYE